MSKKWEAINDLDERVSKLEDRASREITIKIPSLPTSSEHWTNKIVGFDSNKVVTLGNGTRIQEGEEFLGVRIASIRHEGEHTVLVNSEGQGFCWIAGGLLNGEPEAQGKPIMTTNMPLEVNAINLIDGRHYRVSAPGQGHSRTGYFLSAVRIERIYFQDDMYHLKDYKNKTIVSFSKELVLSSE